MPENAAMTPVPVVITFPPMPPRVATTLTIDATIGEGHKREAEVTSHPVEVGSDVTDNIRPKPRSLSLSGIISTAPTTWAGRSTIMGTSSCLSEHHPPATAGMTLMTSPGLSSVPTPPR